MKSLLFFTFAWFALSYTSTSATSQAVKTVQVFVSPDGDDSNPGTRAKPVQSILKGLAATRKLSSGSLKSLVLAGGIYELNAPIILGEQDSGLIIRAEDSKNPPRLIGGRVLEGFQVLKDKSILSKLPVSVHGLILVADLKKQHIKDYGKLKTLGFAQGGTSAMELFVNGRRGTLARYPNHGWMKIESIPKGKDGHILTAKVSRDRLDRWSREDEPWLYGYWYHGWADRFLTVKKIEPAQRSLTLHEVQHYGLRKGQRFFALNMLCELDAPGEYFIDREDGKIFLYPSVKGGFEAMVSTFEEALLQVIGARSVKIQGLIVEVGRGNGIVIKNSEEVTLFNCHVRNLGNTGIFVTGGQHAKIVSCDVHDTGATGIMINGGDRKTLTPSNHQVLRNHVHHISRLRRTYTPAISINGVGNSAVNNTLHHAPHQAIAFNGNDHLIEKNDIHHVVLETDDSGAIYTCPRDFTSRGTMILHNYLHHCGPRFAKKVPASKRTEKHIAYEPMHIHGTSLIYLDDLTGGMTVKGNVLEGAYRAMLIGGGRDNLITGNLILGGNIGIWIDGRGLGWAAKKVAKGGDHRFFRKFEIMGGDKPPYVTRYPGLKTVLTDHPAAPVNTVASGNVVLGAKHWRKTDGKSDPYIRWQNNYHTEKLLPKSDNKEKDAREVYTSPQKWLERIDSEELKKVNFAPIPFDQIGHISE